jgi:hypothetical protein
MTDAVVRIAHELNTVFTFSLTVDPNAPKGRHSVNIRLVREPSGSGREVQLSLRTRPSFRS